MHLPLSSLDPTRPALSMRLLPSSASYFVKTFSRFDHGGVIPSASPRATRARSVREPSTQCRHDVHVYVSSSKLDELLIKVIASTAVQRQTTHFFAYKGSSEAYVKVVQVTLVVSKITPDQIDLRHCSQPPPFIKRVWTSCS